MSQHALQAEVHAQKVSIPAVKGAPAFGACNSLQAWHEVRHSMTDMPAVAKRWVQQFVAHAA